MPLHPVTMSTAQLAAVSYLARYSGHTHALSAYQLRRWFAGVSPTPLPIARTDGQPGRDLGPAQRACYRRLPDNHGAALPDMPTSARDGGGDTAPLCVRNASGAYSFVATTRYPSASGSNVLFSTRSPTLCNSDSSSPY